MDGIYITLHKLPLGGFFKCLYVCVCACVQHTHTHTHTHNINNNFYLNLILFILLFVFNCVYLTTDKKVFTKEMWSWSG